MEDLRKEVETCRRQLIEANAQAVREQLTHSASVPHDTSVTIH